MQRICYSEYLKGLINQVLDDIRQQFHSLSRFSHCVATHGGAIALYGESYIRVGKNTTLRFYKNHAFQRGGAIYANSAPGVVPVSNCFLQIGQLQDGEENRGAIIFMRNTAKAEGKSVYVSEIRNCFSGNTLKNITTNFALHHPEVNDISISLVSQVIFTFAYCTLSTPLSPQCLNVTSKQYGQMLMQREIASGPNYVGGATVDLSKPQTISFIPGKQKRLPYTHVYDEFGSNISSVFTVLINKMDDSVYLWNWILSPNTLPTLQSFSMVFHSNMAWLTTPFLATRPTQLQ